MHLLVRETRSLDEEESAVDLGQTPADIVLLSFSDSDLGAFAAAWAAADEDRPALRLANLARLKHPMSVDLYVEQVIAQARSVVVRLLGGLDYWRYGAEELAATCRRQGTALALLPGDGRDDPRLAELSTVDGHIHARLDACFRHGGPANLARALALLGFLAGRGIDDGAEAEPLPQFGEHALRTADRGDRPLAIIVFYRSYLLAGDLAPIEALAAALDGRGLDARALYVGSLKDAETAAFIRATLVALRPAVVLNLTGFAARMDAAGSPLDAAQAPVLQLVLSGSARDAWEASSRGLSQTDLAMQVVLPELDGRLLAGAVSFKAEQAEMPGLEFARVVHQPDPDGIAFAAARAAGWARLSGSARAARRIALVLSDYPGAAGQSAHAVGLDAIASTREICDLLTAAGYGLGGAVPDEATLVRWLCDADPAPFLSFANYRALFAALPADMRDKVAAAWGLPEDDPAVAGDGFMLRHMRCGNLLLAIQPDRGSSTERKASYHDPDLPPRHGYVAFYLWLRHVEHVHAMVHLGTHGTLEWLPGKSVALSPACFPAALTGDLPVVYPFIVNNPGEAAAAKRRLGALTIGHLTPPLKSAGAHGAAGELERLIDEYAAADGLDRRRTMLLRREILARAETDNLLAESGATPEMSEDDRLARLDAYLCDVKDLQIRDGLHVFGRAPTTERRDAMLDSLMASCRAVSRATLCETLDASAAAERDALLAALDGRFVAPGPAGAPTRGRADVLPTGRNLYAIDPRGVPTRSALVLAEKAASELLRRHLQDHGDWPKRLVIDLWGSATMRTGGEDLALALVLMGAKPLWDEGSARVTGIEILPVALLDRPRIDVTLRISGLFRDAFETQIELFDSAVRAIAARDEAPDWNPLAAAARGLAAAALRRATTRIYGSAPGDYGAGVSALVEAGAWETRGELGDAYLAASAHAYGHGLDGASDAAGFAARVRGADAFVHQQDHREIDLLDSSDYAAHEGGFGAAAERLGGSPALYHTDTGVPDAPKVRTLTEEIARVVRGRAANPTWIAGMMRHGYRGAAEIARGLDGLYGFAATLPTRFDRQFDLVFEATLGDEAVDRFLRDANPAAREAMAARFDEAMRRGLWQPKRNAVAEVLEARAS